MSEKDFAEYLPTEAKKFVSGAADWARENPTEAALIGVAGGFLVGLSGFSRLYRGVNALRSMPLVTQFLVGAVAKGLISRELETADSIH